MITVEVDELFLFPEDHRIVAHLASFDWDFGGQKEVTIRRGAISLRAREIGSGNHEGNPVAVLRPVGSWEQAAELVRRIKEEVEGVVVMEKG